MPPATDQLPDFAGPQSSFLASLLGPFAARPLSETQQVSGEGLPVADIWRHVSAALSSSWYKDTLLLSLLALLALLSVVVMWGATNRKLRYQLLGFSVLVLGLAATSPLQRQLDLRLQGQRAALGEGAHDGGVLIFTFWVLPLLFLLVLFNVLLLVQLVDAAASTLRCRMAARKQGQQQRRKSKNA